MLVLLWRLLRPAVLRPRPAVLRAPCLLCCLLHALAPFLSPLPLPHACPPPLPLFSDRLLPQFQAKAMEAAVALIDALIKQASVRVLTAAAAAVVAVPAVVVPSLGSRLSC